MKQNSDGLVQELGFNSRGSLEIEYELENMNPDWVEVLDFGVRFVEFEDETFVKEGKGDEIQEQDPMQNNPVRDNLQQQFIQRANSSRRRGGVDAKTQVENQIATLRQKFDEAIKEHNEMGNVGNLRRDRFDKLPNVLPDNPSQLEAIEKEVFVIHEMLNKYMKAAVTQKTRDRSKELVEQKIDGPLENIGDSVFKKGEKDKHLEKTAGELLDKEKRLPQENFTGIICIGKIEDRKLRTKLLGKIRTLDSRDLEECFQAGPTTKENVLDKLFTKTCVETAVDDPKWFLKMNQSTLETEAMNFNPKSGFFRETSFAANLIGGFGMAMTCKGMKKKKDTFLEAAKQFKDPGDLAVALVKIVREIKVPNEIILLCHSAYEKALIRFKGSEDCRKIASKTVTGIVLLRVFLPQVSDFFQKAGLKDGMKVCQGLQKLANGQEFELLKDSVEIIEQAIDLLVNDLLERATELRKNN